MKNYGDEKNMLWVLLKTSYKLSSEASWLLPSSASLLLSLSLSNCRGGELSRRNSSSLCISWSSAMSRRSSERFAVEGPTLFLGRTFIGEEAKNRRDLLVLKYMVMSHKLRSFSLFGLDHCKEGVDLFKLLWDNKKETEFLPSMWTDSGIFQN